MVYVNNYTKRKKESKEKKRKEKKRKEKKKKSFINLWDVISTFYTQYI